MTCLANVVFYFICYHLQVGVAKEILLGLLELLGDCADIWGCVKLFEATKTGILTMCLVIFWDLEKLCVVNKTLNS